MEKFANYIDGIGGKNEFSDQELIDYMPYLMPLVFFMQRLDSNWLNHKYELRTLCEQVCHIVSELPQKGPTCLTASMLLAKGKTGDLSTIVYLNLHGLGITRIEELDACRHIEDLILSCNAIEEVEGLTSLLHVKALDLSFNKLKKMNGVSGMSKLRSLLLNHNQLSRLEDLSIVRKHAASLTEIDLRGNFFCKEKDYRCTTLRFLSSLQILDGSAIGKREKSKIMIELSELSVDKILLNHLSELAAENDVSKSKAGDWTLQVEVLNINHEGLVRVKNVERLVNLRRASFAHNVIVSVDGLGYCTALEDLSLEDNRIACCDNLQYCQLLRRLDVSQNELHEIETLGSLRNLTQLSMENNLISGLSTLIHFSVLMELYIGNNQIASIQEIDYLRQLPKLIILDLSGNPLCSAVDYRLYTLFRMRRLKVLDGSSVQIEEFTQAREKFSGKLTREILSSRLGHKSYMHVCQLEISSLKLRDLSILDQLDFSNLSELIADNNQLSVLPCCVFQLFCYSCYLGTLPSLRNICKLKILRLNRNRIETAIRLPPSAEAAQSELASLWKLEVLELAHNRVTDVRDLLLHRYPLLHVLTLQSNLVCHVAGLGLCNELHELDLSKNRIRQFSPEDTVGLALLRELHMEEAGLRSLLHLTPLKSLINLHLAFNRIGDIWELERLSGVGCITEITMCNNPVARKQLYRPTLICQIPSVCWIDGREVLEDERDRAEVFLRMERPLHSFLHEVHPVRVESASKQAAGRISPLNMSSSFAVGILSDPGASTQRAHRSDAKHPQTVSKRTSFLPH